MAFLLRSACFQPDIFARQPFDVNKFISFQCDVLEAPLFGGFTSATTTRMRFRRLPIVPICANHLQPRRNSARRLSHLDARHTVTN